MTRWLIPLACCILFAGMGFALASRAGIQNDEALFASGIYEQSGLADGVKIGGHRIPLMLLSYLGAAKSWVYAPIFRVWRPSTASLRAPVILAGAVTIWLFWSLVWRIAGYRAAAVACVLLATDSMFLATTVFDWGPVALQHLLMVSGCLCLVRFHQEKRPGFLATGFFLFGVALWDKALFAWIGSGMALAALLVFPRELRRYLIPRHFAAAMLAFAVGSAPLITYNVRHSLETFRSNASFDASDIAGKSRLLSLTLKGQSLFGYIPRDDPAGHPRDPQGALERASIWLSEKIGSSCSSFLYPAMIAALLLMPALWFTEARRPMAFAAIATAIAWVQMLLTRNTGGSVHHVILLWPFPALFAGVAFAAASRRIGAIGKPLLAALVVLVAGSNLLMVNEFFARLVRNGTSVTWTDAIYPLSHCLNSVKASVIYIDDWGMFDNLRMMNRGKLRLRDGNDPLQNPAFAGEERRIILARIAESGSVFVQHTDGNELFAPGNARLRSIAAEAGFERELIAEIGDRNGRPIFEVVRFVRRNRDAKI